MTVIVSEIRNQKLKIQGGQASLGNTSVISVVENEAERTVQVFMRSCIDPKGPRPNVEKTCLVWICVYRLTNNIGFPLLRDVG